MLSSSMKPLNMPSPSTFVTAINYSTYKQKVPFGLTWAIVCVVIKTFTPIMHHCVLDQYEGYWLLFDALHVAIVISIQP